jgi:hypothetical protein
MELATLQSEAMIAHDCNNGMMRKGSNREDPPMKKRAIAVTLGSTILIVALAGCGGGGGGGTQPTGASTASSSAPPVSSVTVTEDGYGLQNSTFLTSDQSNGIFVMRAAIASGDTDPNFRTVFRIDVFSASQVERNVTYRIGDGTSLPAFPGEILFFNGHQSTLLHTAGGTITFTDFGTHTGDLVAGNFAVALADGYSGTVPQPEYAIKANFKFILNAAGPVTPVPLPIPSGSLSSYTAKCSSCHALGTLDSVAESAPDLALKGGVMDDNFTLDVPGHQGISLAPSEIKGLKVILNAQ